MFKGQSPQERSLLRRKLSLSNYSSCCCWTYPLLLLSDCCCLILKRTDSASDMRLAIWKSKPPCKVWQLIVSATMLQTNPGDCEHTKFSQGKLGALSVTWGLCHSLCTLPWNRAHPSSAFAPSPVLAVCPAMSCNPQKAQPAQSLLPNSRCCRSPGHPERAQTQTLCPARGSEPAAQGAALQCSTAAPAALGQAQRDQWGNAAPRGFSLPVPLKNTVC